MRTPNLVYLKIKLKSLAEESRIIRREEAIAKRHGESVLLASLHLHRKIAVGGEARATIQAYALLRGKPRAECIHLSFGTRNRGEDAKDRERVKKMVLRYGGPNSSCLLQNLPAWWAGKSEPETPVAPVSGQAPDVLD